MLYEKRFKEADELMDRFIDNCDNGFIDFYRNSLTCDRIYIELIGECGDDIIKELRINDNMRIVLKIFNGIRKKRLKKYCIKSNKKSKKHLTSQTNCVIIFKS